MNAPTPWSLNGKVEAPHHDSGASVIISKPTAFPQRRPQSSFRTLFYYLSRHLFAGVPLTRWLLIALWFVVPLWRVWDLPGGWWISIPILFLWGVAVAWLRWWQQRDYVQFTPLDLPVVLGKPLSPQDKIPVYVTGFFSVEGKEQRFTWLPGFFRTFATREHALMCQVLPNKAKGIGRWPADEHGLWYIFFRPEEILAVAWGELYFGRTMEHALAVTYQRVIPKRGRFRPEHTVQEVIYIAMEHAAEGEHLLANLQFDRQQLK